MIILSAHEIPSGFQAKNLIHCSYNLVLTFFDVLVLVFLKIDWNWKCGSFPQMIDYDYTMRTCNPIRIPSQKSGPFCIIFCFCTLPLCSCTVMLFTFGINYDGSEDPFPKLSTMITLCAHEILIRGFQARNLIHLIRHPQFVF